MRLKVLSVAVLLLGLSLTGCMSDTASFVTPTPSSPPDPGTIAVYLRNDVTENQKQRIEATLHAVPGVSGVRFVSREQAYEQFKKMFEDQPKQLQHVRPENFPEVYQGKLSDIAAAGTAATKLRRMAGVKDVNVTVMP